MGAERGVHSFEVVACWVALALYLDTLMVVDVVLPAVLSLVGVGKPRIEWRSLQFNLLLSHLFN